MAGLPLMHQDASSRRPEGAATRARRIAIVVGVFFALLVLGTMTFLVLASDANPGCEGAHYEQLDCAR